MMAAVLDITLLNLNENHLHSHEVKTAAWLTVATFEKHSTIDHTSKSIAWAWACLYLCILPCANFRHILGDRIRSYPRHCYRPMNIEDGETSVFSNRSVVECGEKSTCILANASSVMLTVQDHGNRPVSAGKYGLSSYMYQVLCLPKNTNF